MVEPCLTTLEIELGLGWGSNMTPPGKTRRCAYIFHFSYFFCWCQLRPDHTVCLTFLVFPSILAHWQARLDQTACVTFFVFPLILPVAATARPYGVQDFFCVWLFQMTVTARPYFVHEIFCSLFFCPMAITARPDGVRDMFCFSVFCRWRPRPDHMACVTFFSFFLKFWPFCRQGQTRRRAWHFCFSFFLPLTATASPYGVLDNFVP